MGVCPWHEAGGDPDCGICTPRRRRRDEIPAAISALIANAEDPRYSADLHAVFLARADELAAEYGDTRPA